MVKLANMTIADLRDLRGGLTAITKAAEVLAAAGIEPRVFLRPGETVIRAPGLWGPEDPGEVVLIEDDRPPAPPIEPDPAPIPDGRGRAALDAAVQVPERRIAAAEPAELLEQASAPAIAPPPAKHVTGPFTEDERRIILDRAARGDDPSAIAASLNRRVTGVIGFLKSQENRGRPGKPQKRQLTPPGDTSKGSTSTAKGGGGSAPAVGSACPRASETGQPARQTGAGAVPMPAPARMPPANLISGDSLGIWMHLEQMESPAPWTAAADLSLAEGLFAGKKLDTLSRDLGIARPYLLARWRELAEPIEGPKGLTLDGQGRLLKLLRWRADRAATGSTGAPA